MIKILNKIINKYKSLSIEMKATAWYTIGNVIQKFAPWVVMIILTHCLAVEQYGVYSIFMSWLEIFEIIITLRIYSNGYVAGLIRDERNQNNYTATMQSLCVMLIVFWFFIYLIFHHVVNNLTEINISLTVMMISSFLGTISFGLWSSRMRVNNEYKKMIIAIVLYGLIGPVIGAVSVFLNLDNPIFYVIAIRTIIQLLVSIPFFISNYKNSTKIFINAIAIDALKYNLPLVPYYLSMILLNHSDRLMIQKISGYSDAALYSLSYSVAMMVFIISGALNLSLQAWLFKELKKNKSNDDRSKLITIGTIIVAFFSIIEILMAPELILLFGGNKYLSAIWVMPPLVMSVIVMYIYQQYVNVLFYYKKTNYLLFASVFSSIINIALNMFFIPKFGYVAGGYTTLASYTLVMCLYYFLAKKECKGNKIEMSNFFNTKLQLFILFISALVSLSTVVLYKNILVRFIFVLLMIIISFVTRKKWIFIFRRGK